VSTVIRDLGLDYWTGTVYTTNRRVWEHDGEFKDYLRCIRAMAVDMETSTIFAAGFANRIPTGALMLVSDQPMVPEGVKTEASDRKVTDNFVQRRHSKNRERNSRLHSVHYFFKRRLVVRDDHAKLLLKLHVQLHAR
jgi:nucleoside phosphorylase